MVKPFFLFLLATLFPILAHAQQRSLDYYISEGLSHSPLLKDYNYQLQAASIDSLLVLSSFRPQAALNAQAMVAPASSDIGYDEAITNGGNYTLIAGASQTLFSGRAKTTKLQQLELLKQSLGVNNTITQTDLRKGITSQYITAFSDLSQLQFNRQVFDLLKDQQVVLTHLVEAGIYPQTDLMNLAINLHTQKIACDQSFIQYKNDIALMNLICGLVDTTTVELKMPEIELTNPFNPTTTPFMLQSAIDSMGNQNAMTLADLNYRPKLEAFADAGFMSIRPENVPHNFGVSLGLNFSMPVYDGRQRQKEHKKLEIAENSRKLRSDFYTDQCWQQHHQLMEQLKLTNNLIVDIKLNLERQKELIGIYRKELEKGLIRLSDLILVINIYTVARQNLANSEMNRLQLINQLNYLK